MIEPRFYHHECEGCLYLGSYAGRDIYRCPRSGMPTIVARYGDADPEYESGPLLWLKRRNDPEKDALGFEVTDTSIRVHNSDGVFKLADGTSTICLNPWTAELIESLPQDIRESPFLPLALDEIDLRPLTPQMGAWLVGDVRARMARLEALG